MFYFSEDTITSAFNLLKDGVENKFIGILGILKSIKSDNIRENFTYCINDGDLAKWLDDTCYLDIYNGKYSESKIYIKFSRKWKEYVNDYFIRKDLSIYSLIVFIYKFESFNEKPTHDSLLKRFCKDFHLSQNTVNVWFNSKKINIDTTNTKVSKNLYKSKLKLLHSTISFSSPYSVSARAGELSRAPFIQTLYAGMDSIKCLLILKDNIDLFYNNQTIQIKNTNNAHLFSKYRPYISAIKSKPFLLLAGISGTGKSRIVRELARACWNPSDEKEKIQFEAQKPENFEMIQVKPNWHDSSELLGYVSRIGETPTFVAGDFLKFIVKAWEHPEKPYFLCLDEMNLAPVEQYFAEYLSVIESRKAQANGKVLTDPIIKEVAEEWYFNLTVSLTSDENLRKKFNSVGISIPQNLIVVGTVNMDETTFSFSRKVLDRAMTIEMNEVNLMGGLEDEYENIGLLGNNELVGTEVEGKDVYADNKEVCNTVIKYLQSVNDKLEDTPFKIAYRTRNEFLLYVVNNLPYNKDKDGNEIQQELVIARALDEITNMKILSRIEGDDSKVSHELLDKLKTTIENGLKDIYDEFNSEDSVSIKKLKEMDKRLESGYTSFWS